jgi:hypothetical protein
MIEYRGCEGKITRILDFGTRWTYFNLEMYLVKRNVTSVPKHHVIKKYSRSGFKA